MCESVGGAASVLVLDKWTGQIDEDVCIEKFDFNMEPLSFFHLDNQVPAATGCLVLSRLQVLSQTICVIFQNSSEH